jgi:hypothetical protein
MPRFLRVVPAVAATFLFAACASAPRTPSSTGTQNAVPNAAQAAIANAISVAGAPFVGSLKTKKFYPASCHTVKLIKPAEQVGFASVKDAETAGFSRDLYSTDCRL